MQHKQAQTLTDEQIQTVLQYIRSGVRRHALRDEVIFLLSFKAGLRAVEISRLTWAMVLDPEKQISNRIAVHGSATKGGYGGRNIPINSELREALINYYNHRFESEVDFGFDPNQPLVNSERSDRLTTHSIVNLFAELYEACGLYGCSSHSGRRTWATKAMRNLKTANATIKDVMELGGWSTLSSFQRYIQGDTEAKNKLIDLI